MARPVPVEDEDLLARLAVALAPAPAPAPERGILAVRDAVRLEAERRRPARRWHGAARPVRHRAAVLWGGAVSAAGAGLAALLTVLLLGGSAPAFSTVGSVQSATAKLARAAGSHKVSLKELSDDVTTLSSRLSSLPSSQRTKVGSAPSKALQAGCDAIRSGNATAPAGGTVPLPPPCKAFPPPPPPPTSHHSTGSGTGGSGGTGSGSRSGSGTEGSGGSGSRTGGSGAGGGRPPGGGGTTRGGAPPPPPPPPGQ